MECMKASQVAQWQRTSLPMQDAWVRSLAWEDPLEESIVTHSNIFFFNINLFFNWRLITLQYCSGFAIHYMNQPWVCMCPPSWTPLPSPSHPIPQGYPHAPALSALSHASNLDWRSVSHMILHMFQCYSLKSFHPRLLPESKRLFYISVSLLLSPL